jgi:hypothetical protein
MTDIQQPDGNLSLAGSPRNDDDRGYQDGGEKRNDYDGRNRAHAKKVSTNPENVNTPLKKV